MGLLNVFERILGRHAVPSADSADNTYIRDVLGNKSDSHSGSSLYSRIKIMNEHIHSSMCVYPELSQAPQLTSHANSYEYGSYIEIVPASTITSEFDIHYADLKDMDTNGEYVIEIASGGAGSEVRLACFTVTRSAVKDNADSQPVQTPLIAANTRISARIAHASGGGATARLKVQYHTY